MQLQRFSFIRWLAIACLLGAVSIASAGKPPAAAVATAHPLATAAAREILESGGNAFDAAVAASAALGVVEPYSSGIGGGGFWLLHRAKDGKQIMIDGRETAPLAASADMYLDSSGKPLPQASLDGALAAAIPASPAAWAHIAEHYGRLPLAQSLAPAIRLAQDGFPVDEQYRRLTGFRLQALQRDQTTAAIFLSNSDVPALGWQLRQPDLARTLELLAAQGAAGFYSGPLAEHMVAAVRANGGIWSMQDLRDYRVIEREPVIGNYHDIRIVSASPPSAGGIGLIEMLNILEPYDLHRLEPAQRIHFIVESMRRAYRDRVAYLGDPDFIDMPVDLLLDRAYARGLAQSIRPDRATPSDMLAPPSSTTNDRGDTSHFSILDSEGNRVAGTLTINYLYGAAVVAGNSGVLLNNEMDDFSAAVDEPNVYGLIGSPPNLIAPGKRPLSSMTPTFLETSDRIAILGVPGGSRIITMVLLATLAFADGLPPQDWVSQDRFHQQYLPDAIQLEPDALDERIRAALTNMGHTLTTLNRRYGDMQAILWNRTDDKVEAASDPRGIGASEVFKLSVKESVPQ